MPDDADSSVSRRAFLKLAGAAGLLASCSPPAGPQKLIPYLVPPEDIVPGTPLFFRTACRECPAGCGVTARTREGRVIKLEGNPDDPIGGGALCGRGQATLQRLYAPDRLHTPGKRGADGKLTELSWDDATAALLAALTAAKGTPGAIRLLTRPETGSAGALQQAFMAGLAARSQDRLVLDPEYPAALRHAGQALFERAELPVFSLEDARTIVSFGADFVETWLSPVELARGLARGRGKVGVDRTRLVWIAPRLCLTGVSADSWLTCRSGGELWVALGLLRWLCDPAHRVANLAPEASEIRARLPALAPADVERESGLAWNEIEGLGEELRHRRPSALLGPGTVSAGADAAPLALVVQLINYVLGNVGRTVLYGLAPATDPPAPLADLEALVNEMAAGKVKVLLLHHADPVGSLPPALGFAAAMAHVPLVVSFSDLPDDTTAHAHLVLPDNHPLESFADLDPRRGVVALAQPAMMPLWNTRSTSQVLLDLVGQLPPPATALAYDDVYSFVQSRVAKLFPGKSDDDLAAAQREAQQRGGVYGKVEPAAVRLRLPAASSLLAGPRPATKDGGLDLLVFPTALRQDGGGQPPPWLREVPDPLTTVSWMTWVELSPATADHHGIKEGDLLTLTTDAGTATLPAYVFPGLRDDTVAVPFGGGEALGLIPWAPDPASGGLRWQGTRVALAATGRRLDLPTLEGTPNQEGRTIVRTVSSTLPTLPALPAAPEMYPPPEFPKHRWAMAIDMDRCTGCQACVVACYAENNVPVVGPQAMVNGRNMAWIRVEHFFSQEEEKLRIDPLLMLCQQCGDAPCEPVCPVYATYTNDEGLNAQVYNRCVGTRYCSNNCPYKVRVFNWRDPGFPAPLNLQLNPDVTVRSKGVMEKCTFCVQRIRAVELKAEGEHRAPRDGEIVPACAQSCPARAIVFGDADDPASQVSRLRRDGRGYNVLGELNTRPAITYLARVRQDET
jgi:anaerobic selenocysteine-containing dehydrogenase/Fe-S-cluster-containing dehydrogenase component